MIDEPNNNPNPGPTPSNGGIINNDLILHLLPSFPATRSADDEFPSPLFPPSSSFQPPLPSSSSSSPSKSPPKTLHWAMAGLILFSFTAPGALVSVPFAIGTTGYVFGMLVLCLFTAATCGGCLMLLEIYLAHPHCQNLPELGSVAMGGDGRWGRRMAATAQLCNFVGFLPVSLTINALALQGTLGVNPEESCLDVYILLISVVCLLTTQARVLTNTQALALLSLGAILAAGGIQLGIAFSPSLMPSPSPPTSTAARLFGHPLLPSSHFPTELIRTFLGLTCMSWSFVPCFLVVELSSSMPSPHLFPRSLLLAAFLLLLLFLGVGFPLVYKWGWDIPDPSYAIPSWPSSLPASRVMHSLILLANLVSYALDSVPLVRYCQRVWKPQFDLNDWSPRALGLYLLLSLPSFVFGVLAALVVGNLLALLAFVSALSVPWVTQILPALFYFKWRRRLSSLPPSSFLSGRYHHSPWLLALPSPPPSLPPSSSLSFANPHLLLPAESQGGMHVALSLKEKLLLLLVGGVGIINFLVCAAAAVGKVSANELRGHTQIGCGKWTVYSD